MVLNIILTYLIYLFIFLLPILPSKFAVYSIHFNGDILLLMIIGTYILNILFNKKSRERFLFGVKRFFIDPYSISILVYVLVMFYSVTFAFDKTVALKESIRFSTYVALYFIIRFETDKVSKTVTMIKVYIASTLAVSLIGIYQAISGVGMLQGGKFGLIIRVESTLENPNNLGVFLIISIFPIFMVFIRERNKLKKAAFATTLFLSLVTVVFTFSRNSWLGILFGCILMVFLVNYKFIVSLLIIPIALLVPQIRHRIPDYLSSAQNIERLKFWKIALKIFKDSPVRGSGNGNYPALYSKYIRIYPELTSSETVIHPHNGYLKVLSELGMLGAIPFLLSTIFQFINIRRYTNRTENFFLKSFFTGFMVSYLTFLFMNAFDNFYSAPKVFAYIWILYAISQSEVLNKDPNILIM